LRTLQLVERINLVNLKSSLQSSVSSDQLISASEKTAISFDQFSKSFESSTEAKKTVKLMLENTDQLIKKDKSEKEYAIFNEKLKQLTKKYESEIKASILSLDSSTIVNLLKQNRKNAQLFTIWVRNNLLSGSLKSSVLTERKKCLNDFLVAKNLGGMPELTTEDWQKFERLNNELVKVDSLISEEEKLWVDNISMNLNRSMNKLTLEQWLEFQICTENKSNEEEIFWLQYVYDQMSDEGKIFLIGEEGQLDIVRQQSEIEYQQQNANINQAILDINSWMDSNDKKSIYKALKLIVNNQIDKISIDVGQNILKNYGYAAVLEGISDMISLD